MDNHKIPRKVLLQALQQNFRGPEQVSQESNRHAGSSTPSTENSGDSSRSDSPVNVTKRTVRVFIAQEAVTSFLISTDPNFQAFHDAFIIQLLLIFLFTIVRDSYKAGSLFLDTTFFRIGLGSYEDIGKLIAIEICVLAWSFAVHPLFRLWVYFRSIVPKLVDMLFVLSYLSYLAGGLALTVYTLVAAAPLPRLIIMIAGVEQFRLFMKSYSFIRENAYKVLYPWHKDDTSGPAVWYAGQMSPTVGSFRQYCYFLFAPTLLYRDHYPRTLHIRWYAVLTYASQMFVALWSAIFIAVNILYPSSLKKEDVLHCCMLSFIMGLLSLVLCNIILLHSYSNLTAELMRFADRKFYDTWWTCTSFSSFYRKWNLLVHDWIHSYVYLDLKKVLGKHLAVFITILVSSIVHEYLLALGVGFLLPVITPLFAGSGMFFYLLKPHSIRRMSNLFVLGCLSFGMAIINSVLLLEYASRQYCPVKEKTWSDLWTPRLVQCYNEYNQ